MICSCGGDRLTDLVKGKGGREAPLEGETKVHQSSITIAPSTESSTNIGPSSVGTPFD